jgi:glycosyltransferase involved in cell wall biosynthesis
MPVLRASVQANRVYVTRKFLEGVEGFAKHWPEGVRVLLEPNDGPTGNLDEIPVDPSELPFDLRVVSFARGLGAHLEGASVVLGASSYRQNHLARLCASLGVPCVYGLEYTLRTRRQIIRAETSNPLRRWRRDAWELNQERRQRAALRRAAGAQCNGAPAYEAYRALTPRTLLFFDTRTTAEMIATDEALARREARMRSKRPLTLAFSGRLHPMKGAQHLPRIADELRRRGVRFEMLICGGGPLERSIAAELDRLDLRGSVKMKGVLDFRAELAPLVRDQVDLFVCPHVQGDPSCTYLETFACGVPMVGYDNEAFGRLMSYVDAGWRVPLGDAGAAAGAIAALDRHRMSIVAKARAARDFAREHTFEATCRRRMEHLRSCMTISLDERRSRSRPTPTLRGSRSRRGARVGSGGRWLP